jgi:predicted glycoside hydrolase/deacetylase ChbG (UPF0249 family)
MKEIDNQIQLFISLTGKSPSHIDGHQHIQFIPLVAPILSRVMTNYGIYKLRQVNENLMEHIQTDFYKQVQVDVSKTLSVYEENNIVFPNVFVGINLMGKYLNSQNIMSYLKSNHFPRSDDFMIEIMCHPGDKSDFFDDFNKSDERI